MSEYGQFQMERRRGIGGSDMADLFQIEPYGCPRKLMYDKLGLPRDHGASATLQWLFDRGRLLEPGIRQRVENEIGERLQPEFLISKKHEWARANVDGISGSRIAEFKALSPSTFYEYKRNGLPDGYILQLQYALWIHYHNTGTVLSGIFGILNVVSGDLETFGVDINPRLHEQFAQHGAAFWKAKMAGEFPERLHPESKPCQECPWRTTCHGEFVMPARDDRLHEDLSIRDLALDYENKRQKYEAELERLKEELQNSMGDREKVAAGNGCTVHYSWRTGKESIDQDAIKSELLRLGAPADLSAFKKTGSPFRVLRVYGVKGNK